METLEKMGDIAIDTEKEPTSGLMYLNKNSAQIMTIIKAVKTDPSVEKAHNAVFYKNFYVAGTTADMKKTAVNGDYFTISYKAIYDHYFDRVIGEKDESHHLESTDWNNVCREITKPFLIEEHIKDGKERQPVVDKYGLYINVKVNNLYVLAGIKSEKKVQHGKTVSATNKILTVFGRDLYPIRNVCYIDWDTIPEEIEKLIDWSTAASAIVKEKAQKKR
jgi:hypothetical protein